MTAAESLPDEANVVTSEVSGSKADTVATAEVGRVGQDETSTDEKNDAGSEMEEKREREAPGNAKVHANHVDREVFPTTFDDLCRQMTERANFLLEVMHLLTSSSLQAPSGNTTPSCSPLCPWLATEDIYAVHLKACAPQRRGFDSRTAFYVRCFR